MKRLASPSYFVLLLVVAAILLEVNGCGGGNSTSGGQTGPGVGKIQHVVIIFQENRTPDNLFHDPVLISRGADIASSGTNSSGQTVPLVQSPLWTPITTAATPTVRFWLCTTMGKWMAQIRSRSPAIRVHWIVPRPTRVSPM